MEDKIYYILTDLLRDDISKGEAIEKLLVLCDVVKSLPTKKIMHFDEWLKFLKWEQIGNSYVYKQGNRYKDANELKQIHSAYPVSYTHLTLPTTPYV